ncbi:MAG: site-2 protease family protein [Cellulomonas sp.]|nr:site-2 protease family protein [Cellulomonas sp.]
MAWILENAAWINVVLGVFNLVPGLPLDGGHVLEALVWKITGRRTSGTVAAAWIGRVVAVSLVVAVVVGPYLNGGRPSMFGVVWAMIIAWTLWSGASGALRYVRHTAAAGTLSPASVGRRAVGVVADTSVAQALRTAHGVSAEAVVVLGPDGRPAAYVDPTAVASVPREAVGVTAVSAVAVPLPEGAVVDVSVTGEQLLAAFGRTGGVVPLVVTAGGQVVAVVVPGDVAQVLQG